MFAALPTDLAIGSREFRERVFSGAIYKPRCEGGAPPARVARRWLTSQCGELEALGRRWRAKDWPKVMELQKQFRAEPGIRQAVQEFIGSMAPGASVLVDEPRLRVVFPDGHLVPRAAPAYLPHRDTWFANSESQLNWWMPLVTVTESMSFGFWPEYFEQAVENTSANFDYTQWAGSGGFQRGRDEQREYPTTKAVATPQRFRCGLDEYLCFSAAHLHQTMLVRGECTRISMDFRTLWSTDRQEKRGAPNVDNQSSGDATIDYSEVLSTRTAC